MIVPYRGQKAVKRKQKVKKTKKTQTVAKTEQEVGRLGAMLRLMGGAAGAGLGGFVGYPGVGGSIGSGLGAALSKWLGAGDYTVSGNSLLGPNNIPAMHNADQTIVVRHKEYVGELVGSTAFKVQKAIALNPGLRASFPWLSVLAGAYTEYRIRGMVFHYVPTSGAAVASTNPALGSVMFQTTYRATDVQPTSKQEMLNEYCANETVPCEPLAHPIECAPQENPFKIMYVRGTVVPTGDTPLLYDLGNTFIATSGMQTDNHVVGDVWVTYEIEFKKPVVTSSLSISKSLYFQFKPASPTNLFNAADFTSISNDLTANNTNVLTLKNMAIGRLYTFGVLMSATSSNTTTGIVTFTGAALQAFSPNIASTQPVAGAGPMNGLAFFCSFLPSSTDVTMTFNSGFTTGGTFGFSQGLIAQL